MTRWIITVEADIDGDSLGDNIRAALPSDGRLVMLTSDNWHERDDVTHACPICLRLHFPGSEVT